MSNQDLLLKDFRPRTALVTEDHTPDRARLPVIDAHNHYDVLAKMYYENACRLIPGLKL